MHSRPVDHWVITTLCVAGLAVPSLANSATQWKGCTSALEGLRDSINVAVEAARRAESEQEDVTRCLQYPDVYDLMHDNCLRKRVTLRSLGAEALGKSEQVADHEESVEMACGIKRSPAQRRHDQNLARVCNVYQSVQAMTSREKALEYCTKGFESKFCEECLDSR